MAAPEEVLRERSTHRLWHSKYPDMDLYLCKPASL